MNKSVSWLIMTLLSIGIALYALSAALLPTMRNDFVANMVSNSSISSVTHFFFGGIVLIAGAFQFHQGLRKRHLTLHRWLGRVYVIGVTLGGVAGLLLAVNSNGGLVAHFGFGMLAVLWLFTTLTAYLAARARDIDAHRAWMTRSYALTLAAVTLRLYLPLSMIAGIEFEAAYQAIAWLCWVPNLLIAEWFFVGKKSAVESGLAVSG